MKRLFDFTVSAVALVVLSPVMIAVAALVLVKLGRPIFFVQERPGYLGKPFRVYKFRTMSQRRDADGNLLPDAERLGSLGRTLRSLSLDELPQLINVLEGDLSLVGPRPLLMEYLPLYSQRQALRHSVRPGITGWAQVNGRNAVGWPERLEMDAWYAEHRSFALDMKILWMTLMTVLKREGINELGEATARKFTGNDQ